VETASRQREIDTDAVQKLEPHIMARVHCDDATRLSGTEAGRNPRTLVPLLKPDDHEAKGTLSIGAGSIACQEKPRWH
jgi:hypothetical protein